MIGYPGSQAIREKYVSCICRLINPITDTDTDLRIYNDICYLIHRYP